MHEPKTIPVKKLFDVAKIPTKANVSDAGYDLSLIHI
jgi:hypothetical protein